MNCRHCQAPLQHTFLDLGFAPPSNAYLSPDDLTRPERYYPLKISVCGACWLVQTEDYAEAEELFSPDYAYFSSTSTTWLRHAEEYVSAVITDLAVDRDSLVVELACNDGYLLKNFVDAHIPCLGVEPTNSTAEAAEAHGIPVIREFFGEPLANRMVANGQLADLIIGNNVYAHVPNINDFTKGMQVLLKPGGTITLEFPHLMRLIESTQFDTVYHEHFSYLSLTTVQTIFGAAGLKVWRVEELPTHGGSLRVYGCHAADPRACEDSVADVLGREQSAGLQILSTYLDFQIKADQIKNNLLAFLLEQKNLGKTVAAYGAAAKGNTLLNYAGVKPDLLSFVCDAAAAKQDKYMPGSHIPILAPEAISEREPDFVVILPWNIADEVIKQNDHVRNWGGRFVTAIPKVIIK